VCVCVCVCVRACVYLRVIKNLESNIVNIFQLHASEKRKYGTVLQELYSFQV
jgi:hypothetical protein